jgi:hypothetical protein
LPYLAARAAFAVAPAIDRPRAFPINVFPSRPHLGRIAVSARASLAEKTCVKVND